MRHIKPQFKRYSFLLFVITMFLSCESEEDPTSTVITEEVLYVSGENVTIVGRILSIASSQVTSHGFLIDTSEDFNNPIQIDLGTTSDLGRYIAEVDGLEPGIPYFCRSFMEIDGQQIVGNVLSFNSLLASLTDFSPRIGNGGETLEILGSNFTQDVRVFFNGEEVAIEKVEFESKITVKIPNPQENIQAEIRVVMDGQDLTFSTPFEYVTGKWVPETTFLEDDVINDIMYFVSDDNFYMGMGRRKSTGQLNNQVWSLNLQNYEWQLTPFTAVGREPFSAGTFFGGGAISFLGTLFSDQFWEFDGENFIEQGRLPFRFYKAVSFDFPDAIYVTGGEDESRTPNRLIYRFDKVARTWEAIGEVPFDFSNPTPHFSDDDAIYMLNRIDNVIYRYSLTDRAWTKFVDFPFEVARGGIAINYDGNRVFMGTFDLDDRIYELDLSTKTWKNKLDYPESQADNNIAVFQYDDKIYFLKESFSRSNEGQKPMQLWSFDPDKI